MLSMAGARAFSSPPFGQKKKIRGGLVAAGLTPDHKATPSPLCDFEPGLKEEGNAVNFPGLNLCKRQRVRERAGGWS